MKTEQELTEFYERLKKELDETTTFPTTYLYKFIIPSSSSKLQQLEKVFEQVQAEIKTRPSSNGKYTGVSVSVILQNSDEVIHYYREAGKIEGIVSL